MKKEGDIGKLFLESFMKQVLRDIAIKNMLFEKKRVNEIKEKIDIYESKNDPFENESLIPVPKPPQRVNEELVKSIFANQTQEVVEKREPEIKKIVPMPQRPPQRRIPPRTVYKPKNLALMTKPVIETNPAKTLDSAGSISIDNIDEFTGNSAIDKILQDKDVQTLECPGPNKRVLVYKSGKINAANIQLNEEEIKKIMDSFSLKTRIPIGSGFFKAALGDFLITAVLSEFVGTRFVMQRKPKIPSSSL